jgi:hypothetical protein
MYLGDIIEIDTDPESIVVVTCTVCFVNDDPCIMCIELVFPILLRMNENYFTNSIGTLSLVMELQDLFTVAGSELFNSTSDNFAELIRQCHTMVCELVTRTMPAMLVKQ